MSLFPNVFLFFILKNHWLKWQMQWHKGFHCEQQQIFSRQAYLFINYVNSAIVIVLK